MIDELRDQLISDLKTGSDGAVSPTALPVHPPYPGRVVAPCYVIGLPTGPYIKAGQTFPAFEVIATVVVLTPKNDTCLTDLEAMVEYVLANTMDWAMQGVAAPSAFTESGMEMLGTVITLAKQSKL